ncbi:AraC family transcriptional regulator [Bacteroides sp.]|uniref:AraC family transcriptional regulator n=1 Tax=Bacteroides sp. TaxID=29523 RepID=UPI002584E9A3|nr:AraC family transcriptional regulator [Bacteroides sp.]
MNIPFKYIVENEKDALWGLSISTVGYETYKQNEEYPSKKHKSGYYFDTHKGRVLKEYQLCYIPEGRGYFESRSCKRCLIEEGTMFLLFPDEWHTYYPDPQTGWKQYWIGFKGINIDLRVQNGFLKKESPIFKVGINNDLISLYQQAIFTAQEENAHFQLMLAGITNHLLGYMYCLQRNLALNKNPSLVDRINKAQAWMQEELEEPLSIQEIAEKLGMSYSFFRKSFKEYAGISPSKYLQDIRLQRARELLSTTDLTVKEIAYRLHFETPDYFSAQFRKKVGVSPSSFRE